MRALRSGRNYAHQVAERLSPELIDVTCSGATTANILTRPQRTFAGVMRPQIEAVAADAGLVTITAGGNDIAYVGSLIKGSIANELAGRLSVLPEQLKDKLRASVSYVARAEQLDAVADSLADVARQVRARAPQARVLLIQYVTVLGPDARTSARLPLTPGEIGRVKETGTALADAFGRAAAKSGADLIRAFEASAGHGVGSAEPWVTGFQLGNPLRGGPVPYHPNLAGMTAVADLVVEHLRQTGPNPAR